ncbi:diacylglycerol/lipid kinase family protein [Microbispora triticiradicis]|uniref:diacylglycerol/lipid kinase family protein n=1 Tax=Microbispora triticiradicis TaxID=2200763 RepID=UPI001AD6CF7F|nr:diacylglycerol kinase family protein [Microbispora triticiradicis]MBO4274058.1 diacylglycerol kinase family lipid kinase [Microbispora triticiradicis]
MRALLLVNPKATSTHRRTRDVLIRALGAAVDLSVEETAYRGHATALAATARAKGFDAVAVLGGDGTINETVNGLLQAHPGGHATERPALIVIPGGSANVFARALGLPNNPVEATGAVLEALREDRRRVIGLGQAIWHDEVSGPDPGAGAGPDQQRSRYFTFCAGLGYDAEVVRAVEGLRSAGYRALPALYVSTAVRHFFVTDRRRPALRLARPGLPTEDGIFMAIVSNTAPWTYAGTRPINPTPWAGFETGLDLLGLRRLNSPAVLSLVRQIIGEHRGLPRGKHLIQTHDEEEFTLLASRPVAFQLDGDYLGEHEWVIFRAIPDALQVLV